jgi:hypothetical protein
MSAQNASRLSTPAPPKSRYSGAISATTTHLASIRILP